MSMQTPKELGGIQFGLMDPETYRDMSATKVITADTYDDDGYPIDMGLMDPRLGVIDPGLQCRTCGQHSGSCNGHFGHIELAAPVIHVGFTKLIRRLLRSTCRECSRLCLTDGEQAEFREQLRRQKELGEDPNDALKAAVRQARKASQCPHCGAQQFDVKHEKPTTYYEIQNVLATDYSERIAGAMQPDPDDEDDRGTSPQALAEETDIALDRVNAILSGEFRPRRDDRKALERALDVDLTEEDMNKLMPSDIRDWFEDIPDDDIESLGIDPDRARPEWMILTVLPVPPVTARPSITLDNGQRSEDDLTHKLVDIIRINQRFMENREAGAPQLIIEDLWELLQYHVTTFIDNEISGTPPARHRSGRPLKTLSQRLKGKEGRFRGSLSGKRVNFSARTVISPDPTLSLNEVGVPERVATEMTQTLNVTERNVDNARQFVRNGPEAHPGANYVRRPDGRRLKVTEKNCEELAEKIEVGWEVNRHLIDGDIVIFNRQPSLHRMSIMAHEVVVMPYKTFRLNTTVCVAGDTAVDCGGYERPIVDVETDWEDETVTTYDPSDSETRSTSLTDFWSLQPSSYGATVHEVETPSGSVVATSDHPFETPDGLTPVEELSPGDRLLRRPIELPAFDPDADERIAATAADVEAAAPPETYVGHAIRTLGDVLPFDAHSRRGVAAARLAGHLFGDGTLELDGQRARLVFRAPQDDLDDISEDLERLGFDPDSPRYKHSEARIVAADGSTTDVAGGGWTMELRSKPLASLFAALGVPAGDKTETAFEVPGWVREGPSAIKRAFLSAYFGAELSTPSQRGPKLFKKPTFKLAKTDDVLDAGRRFIEQIDDLLSEFGTAVSNVREEDGNRRMDGRVTTILAAELDAAQEAVRNLFARIGYTYNREADAEARLATAYLSEKLERLDELAAVATAARTAEGEYGRLTDIANRHGEDPARVRRWRQRDVEQPRANDFPGYETWRAERVADAEAGLVWEEITEVSDADDQRVYDVTTADEAHRFVTNGFVGSNCAPYNADFDGDEMNMHALQNEEARAEARVLMRVQEQILSPRFGENIIGAIQDHVTGTYLLTHTDPEFTETQALDLLRATSVDELPAPDGTLEDGKPYWTGRTLFSELLPDDLSLEFSSSTGDAVRIENGQLVEGTIDEDAVGAFGGEIVDTITKVYGKTRARVFINEVSALAVRTIMHFGFSIGIDDESIPEEAREAIDDVIANAYDRIQELIETYQAGELESLPGRTVDETLEMKIMQRLGKARDSAGEIAEDHFGGDNPAVIMAQSGARGSMLNLTQMAGCVGQQAVRGERINRGYEGRTLSHYAANDLSAEAHGFVENSYRAGLTPREFFFHAMGGREGLVDTAVRTSKSGYLQRRLINALSELEAQYDGTVRDTSDTIVQFEFGEDGTSPVKVSSSETEGIDVDRIADRVVDAEFDSPEEKERFLGRSEPPTNLSEYAGPGLDKAQGLNPGVESDD